jgi:serine/threonine-protein kinase HipA
MSGVEVHVELDGEPVRAGTAYFNRRRQTVGTSFIYDSGWLADARAFPLDPGLPLTGGSHFADGLPGSFRDCSPDRWGRNLISRRARAEATPGVGAAPSLTDVDFLLGVSDLTRQGALRFRPADDGSFVAADHEVPKLIELPKLLRAAEVVAQDTADDLEAVKLLLDAGTGSLGGARPKATVRGDDGALLIAKFPHHHDDWDVGCWEKIALDLAERAGISVPARRLVNLGRHSTLLLDRFDRAADGTRIPYLSALTLVSGRDGDTYDYEDVVAALEESGAGDDTELEALFRRVALSVAIRNTDDHLRNTGFLRGSDGWRLSPAFDINPNPDLGAPRQTAISGADRVDDEPAGLLRLARWCHLDTDEARRLIGEVVEAASDWRNVATHNGATASDIQRFAESFDHQLDALRHLLTSGSA